MYEILKCLQSSGLCRLHELMSAAQKSKKLFNIVATKGQDNHFFISVKIRYFQLQNAPLFPNKRPFTAQTHCWRVSHCLWFLASTLWFIELRFVFRHKNSRFIMLRSKYELFLFETFSLNLKYMFGVLVCRSTLFKNNTAYKVLGK